MPLSPLPSPKKIKIPGVFANAAYDGGNILLRRATQFQKRSYSLDAVFSRKWVF